MDLGTPIAIGNTAKVYLYKDKIFKIFKANLPKTESHYEAEKQRLAFSHGLNVPEVIDVTVIDGQQAIIMEYIKGRTIGDIVSQNMDQTEYYMNISIEVQQKIHAVDVDSLERMFDKLQRQIAAAAHLEERQKSFLIDKMASITYQNRLCHGDFHFLNLILSDSGLVTIIDWVDSSAGDIRADIYRTYLLYSQLSKELAEMYLRLYLKKSDLSKEEIFQWAPIIAGARLSENVTSETTERLLKIINDQYPL
ncbi:phosphotransferase family protein [Oceanobacillus sp. FSL H7-0719]|uniref:phosphotransferase family protein n=1 Tax=Oceanobacillus sp. FSL H7-0719 TaxID=2954507 RepID=UPI00325632BC